MNRTYQAAKLALHEALSRRTLERRPEPTSDMSGRENVDAFHAQGAESGALLGVYHFNARQIHALVPERGIVVDLGCGSGQCLRYIAESRPDLRLLGFDLSEPMVEVGNAMLREAGLAERVTLRVGDMTTFASDVPRDVSLVTSIFSLHHLPTAELLEACLRQIDEVRERHGAGYWIFDHARPRSLVTASRFPHVFTPDASPAFNADSTNSLIASWSYDELLTRIDANIGGTNEHACARVLPLYQVHWMRGPRAPANPTMWRQSQSLPTQARRDADSLARLFGALPS